MAAERSTISVDIQSATDYSGNSQQSTTTGYGPRYAPRGSLLINTDKLVKIPFGKDDIFVDFKTQFIAALEGKTLKRFVTNPNYNLGLSEDHEERLLQVYVYNSICACLRGGGRFPVIRDVQDCNAYAAWQKVLERYEGQSTVTAMALKAQIWGRKLNEGGETLTQLCDWFTERFQMLATTPEKMGETDKKLVLVMAIEKHSRYERIAAMIRHDPGIRTYAEAVDVVRDEVRYLDVLHSEEKPSSNINSVVKAGNGGDATESSEKLQIAKLKEQIAKLKEQHTRSRRNSRGRGYGRGNGRQRDNSDEDSSSNDSDDDTSSDNSDDESTDEEDEGERTARRNNVKLQLR